MEIVVALYHKAGGIFIRARAEGVLFYFFLSSAISNRSDGSQANVIN